MKRRILLILTTLAALVAAFYVYWLVAGLEDGGTRHIDVPHGRRPVAGSSSQPGASIEDADDICIIARDKYGRLEAVYRARKWHRREDGSHLLIEPRVELFHKSDQRTILRADQAEVYGEELDRGVNVRRAKLWGNVVVYFDPSTEPDRTPVEDRPDEVVRVHVDDVEFDKERLTIQTDGPVTVFSPEADVYGQGLSISWNESPRELRLLRVHHGRYMAVYNVPDELDMISLPGGEGQAPGEPEGPGPTSGPTTKPSAGPASRAASQPATQPSRTAPGEAPRVAVSFGSGKPATTASAPATSAPAEPKAQNQYLAEFRENVRVVHRNRRLEGADVLSLRFDWDTSWRRGGGLLGRRRRQRRRQAASRPTTGPATRAGAATQPTTTTAPSQPAEPEREPMEIYWTGPLVIRPAGRTETPSRRRYEVSASGTRLLLTDPRATAACKEFVFRHPEQTGYLKGAGDAPARLLLAEGADVGCERIRFTPGRGLAYLDGAGYMARRFEEGLTQARAVELMETEDPNRVPAGERITWGRNVEIAFTQERTQRPDGTIEARQFIREADFHEKVLLQQSADPNDDFVKCEHLKVYMARGSRVTAYPRKAVATGSVSARQEGSDVRADRVTVHFAEAGEQPAKGAGMLSGRVRPSTVEAEGNVQITDRREGDEPLIARADRLTSSLRGRTAVLAGKPARIEQGTNHLAGEVIHLDQQDGSAVVDGKGTVRFLTKRDMNGRRLSKPRPLEVAWSKKMSFHGKRNTAAFSGDVALDSGMDEVRCGEMQILFAEATPRQPRTQPASQPASRPAAKPARTRRLGGMAVEMERYSRRRISMILADKDINLRSRRENDANQLVRRVQLSGEKLIYDAQYSRMTMLGHGTFVAEDYNKPRSRKDTDGDGIGAAVDRPSQSAFEWDRSMQFSQRDRLVVLEGAVTMVHRSGDKVLLADKLNVPREQWGELKSGRRTVLKCGSMMAKFAEPDEPATRPAGDVLEEGPDLGPVELFSASKDINLKDGPWQVLSQRLIYNRPRDLAVIWGFPEGGRTANATILHEDPEIGRSQSWSSPKIVWYRENNKIVTEEVSGAGGR